ncbi:stem-specific protein TSJT1-like [Camellia sinensis]|uniref:stem-specific protein TSJT1-like n=1 Tax=Camellia sinensis TaxID=4442 RepID=UPI001035AB80|nr:stem-specific protein TSJT1-like [Camellia sinensis]
MLAGFEKSTGKPPEELSLPWKGMPDLKTGEETVEIFRSWRPHSMLFNLPNGNSMALSHEDECPLHPRSIVVVDDVYCIFLGMLLENTCDLRSHYGLSRQVTEAMVVVEAYKVLRDRTPYPPDQVVRDLQGKFAFVLFDARANTLFIARDRDGCIPLQWRMARDGSLVCSDDPNVIAEACGNCCTFFPPGCIYMSGDHPLNKIRAITWEDDEGNISSVLFQVDLFTRLRSIPRTDSSANWAGVTTVDGE